MHVGIYCHDGLLRTHLEHRCRDKDFEIAVSTDRIGELSTLEDGDMLLCYLSGSTEAALGLCEAVREQGDFNIVAVRDGPIDPELADALLPMVGALIPDDDAGTLIFSAIEIVRRGYRVIASSEEDAAKPPAIAPDRIAPGRVGVVGETVERDRATLIEEPTALLSRRENAVLDRLSVGASNTEIARDLDITEATVKVHLRSIFRKLSVSNRTQAAILGSRHVS